MEQELKQKFLPKHYVCRNPQKEILTITPKSNINEPEEHTITHYIGGLHSDIVDTSCNPCVTKH